MPAPTSIDEFLDLVRKSGVLDEKRLAAHIQELRDAGELPTQPARLAAILIQNGILTNYQAEQLVQGRWRRFTIGKYKVLERLGSGGMGSVFLCEHIFMRRRVAVKVLPAAKSADPSALERFYREARAVAAVDHVNIVQAYDIDQDETLHFIVMEYVDGPSLQEIVRRSGPISVERACHYISQAAEGLEHASHAGLVHRDIKPGNILVDRTGVVKVLDLGLARFFNDEEDMLTRKYDENVLGTADYLAPEQADDSHAVDIRADIYSLGGTFYFLLTGKTPFGDGTVPQKLMWHRTRQPKPLGAFREDVPAEVQAILDRMMAKEPDQRFHSPCEISAALAPWTANPILPPSEVEMPRLSPAASTPLSGAGGPASGVTKKNWQVGRTPPPAKPASSNVDKKQAVTPAPAASAGSPKSTVPTPQRGDSKQEEPAVSPRSAQRPAGRVGMPKTSNPPASRRPNLRPKTGQESVTWAPAGPDTADPVARGDTPPLVPAKPRKAKKPTTWVSRLGKNKPLVLAIGGALLTLGLVLVGFLIFWFARS
jgi:eukaryotic-like serine/threonine-protein kinase